MSKHSWMITLLQCLSPKLRGNLKDAGAFQALPYYVVSSLLSPHIITAGAQRLADTFSASPDYFLEVVCTADVAVNVFSFISSQFCYKIGTVCVLLPFRFSRRRLFTVPFPPHRKLPPFPPGHRCNFLEECVPLCFFHWLLSPQLGAFLYILIAA